MFMFRVTASLLLTLTVR